MALGKAAEIDAHARPREADRARLPIEHEMAPAHRFPGTGQRVLARLDAGAVVVEVADRRVGDVEGAAGKAGEMFDDARETVGTGAKRVANVVGFGPIAGLRSPGRAPTGSCPSSRA